MTRSPLKTGEDLMPARPYVIRPPGLNRRAFLGGAGALVALPFLESLVPRTGRAAPLGTRRLLFYYVPNGIHMAAWTPAQQGAGYALTPILQPLSALKDDVLVLSGLANKPAKPDGPGDHAGGTSAFLTCAHVNKSESEIRNAVSVDQLAAAKLGQGTRFQSLQLGLEGGASVGGCDSGYSCAYTRNISWAGPKTPLQKTTSPQVAFDLLFKGLDDSATQAEQARRRAYSKSVLDYARGDAQRLQARLSRTDRMKLDEYLTGVREVEQRIGGMTAQCQPGARPGDGDFPAQVKAMADLMVLAFQCDLTRVITFMLNNAASGRSYGFLGVSGGHHEISHHQNNPDNHAKLQKIDTWEVEQLAYLLQRLKSVKEGDGNLLDNTLVYFSSEIEDGNAHRHTNLPILLGGRLGGAVRPGRHVLHTGDPPLANLFISILGAVGVKVDRFGDDGTAPLAGLT
jgi:hypothetical protein